MPITKKNHGFTLIEIMVAIFVLAIGLLGLDQWGLDAGFCLIDVRTWRACAECAR